MKIVVLSFKIVSAARPHGHAHPPSAHPPVRLPARAGAGRTYIHKTPDRPPWAAVTRIINIPTFRENLENPQISDLFVSLVRTGLVSTSTAKDFLAEVFHPWARWELGPDLRVCPLSMWLSPQPSSPASGKPAFAPLWDRA